MPVSIPPAGHGTPRSPLKHHAPYTEPLPLRVLDGAWPTDLAGHVFVTAPDLTTGMPVFGSDGMLCRFDLRADGVDVRSAFLRTPSGEAARKLAERPDPRLGAGAGFRNVGLARMSPTLGAVECLTVAPVPVGDALWVTSDMGRPWLVDPVDLRLLGPVGDRSVWQPVAPLPWVFPLLLTSGHPAIDPDGTAWEVNFTTVSVPGSPAFFRLLRCRGPETGAWQVIDDATGEPARIFQSVHQMASTEHHLVLLDAAFHVELRQVVVEALRAFVPMPRNVLASFATEAHSAQSVLWVIDKRTIDEGSRTVRARRYALDDEATHFAAAWKEIDGAIDLVILHTPCQDVSEWIREGERMACGNLAHPDLDGMPAGVPMAHGSVGLHRLHPDGRVTTTHHRHDPGTWGPALYTIPPGNLETIEHLWYYTAGFEADALPERLLEVYRARLGEAGLAALPLREGRPSAVVRFDVRSGQFDTFSPPPGWGVFGMCFVPKHGASSPWEGYLFASALSDVRGEETSGDEIWIFEAHDVSAGPICRLGHPSFDLPFTLHTAWVPCMPGAPAALPLREQHDPHATIDAWAESLPVPELVKRSLRRAATRAITPDAVEALLEREVWPAFEMGLSK